MALLIRIAIFQTNKSPQFSDIHVGCYLEKTQHLTSKNAGHLELIQQSVNSQQAMVLLHCPASEAPVA